MSDKFLRRLFLVFGVVVSGFTVFASAETASASDDGGLRQFFSQQFGVNFGSAPSTQPYPYDLPDDRPLVVRPRHKSVSRKPHAAVAMGPVAPVSIYDDKTLRPGDAVMTAKGVRVFLGGNSMPYSEADFASVADSEGLPRQVEKALLAIDKEPRT